MGETRHAFTLDLPGVDPGLLWALLSDTNRGARAQGLPPGEFRLEHDAHGRPAMVGRGRKLGLELEWVSGPDSWVEGRWFHGPRRFRKGPVEEGTDDFRIEPAGDGCRLSVEHRVRGGALGLAMARLGAGELRRYALAAAALARGARSDPEAPAGPSARELLGSLRSVPALLTGQRTPTDGEELHRRGLRLRERPVPAELVERLLGQLAERPDEELSSLQPLRLADRWGADRRELLRTFLHATDAGLLTLEWGLRCPMCRVASRRVPSLGDLPDEVECGCGAIFDADLSHRVEAAFRVHPAIRKLEQGIYCVAGAQLRPHVFAQLVATRSAPCEVTVCLPPGDLLAVVPGRHRESLAAPPPAELGFVVRADGVTVHRSAGPAGGEGTKLSLRTELDGPAEILALERAGWQAEWVSATLLATLPEFHELFAGEAPRSRHEVSVGSITLLFTDLKGSTALYQRVGDPRAFSLVEEHFDRLAEAVARHGGAIVKTMGDALMAVFDRPAEAVRAGLAMHEAIRGCAAAGEGLELKLGIHTGSCIAIRANGRLDFFGNAVNLAARAQAQGRGGDVVLTDAVVGAPEVEPLLAGFAVEPFEAKLKGIDAPQRLWRLAVPAGGARTGS